MFFIPSSGATRHLPPKGKVLKLPVKLKFAVCTQLRQMLQVDFFKMPAIIGRVPNSYIKEMENESEKEESEQKSQSARCR